LTESGTIGYFIGFANWDSHMKSSAAKPPVSFEAALQELEGIVQSLEGGNASLEDSLKSYERGIGLLTYCQSALGQAEQKIKLLDNGTLRDLDLPITDEVDTQ
jgi:exodeoxyribonuclease VII small subunit